MPLTLHCTLYTLLLHCTRFQMEPAIDLYITPSFSFKCRQYNIFWIQIHPMIIRLWSSYKTSVSSDGWSWVGTQSAERLFELPQLFVRSPVEQTGLCNYLPRTSSTFQGPGTPGDVVTFVGILVMLISTFRSYGALTVVWGQLRRETLRIFCVTRDLKESLSLPWEKSLENNQLLVSSTFCT